MCPSTRTVTEAVRLSGPLDLESLQKSFARLVERHEALRTRIVVTNGTPRQQIDENGFRLPLVELTGLAPGDRESEAKRVAEHLVYVPFHVAAGPLFAATLIKLTEFDHVLAVAIDHIVSDKASLDILWREIFTLYAHSLWRTPVSLPEMPVQFADYAVWQQKVDPFWIERHGAYWRERLAGARRIRIFSEEAIRGAKVTRYATLSTCLGKDLSAALRELSRRERTTLVMSVLTVFAAAVFRFYCTSQLVLPFISGGRLQPDLANTIGYFGTPLLLRVELLEEDSFVDLLRRVTAEYGTAYEHSDSCRVAAAIPEPDFVWNPTFNWIPPEFNTEPDENGLRDTLSIERYEISIALRDDTRWNGELRLELSDTQDGVRGVVGYRADLFTLEAVGQFEQDLRFFAQKLVTEPQHRVATGWYSR